MRQISLKLILPDTNCENRLTTDPTEDMFDKLEVLWIRIIINPLTYVEDQLLDPSLEHVKETSMYMSAITAWNRFIKLDKSCPQFMLYFT